MEPEFWELSRPLQCLLSHPPSHPSIQRNLVQYLSALVSGDCSCYLRAWGAKGAPRYNQNAGASNSRVLGYILPQQYDEYMRGMTLATFTADSKNARRWKKRMMRAGLPFWPGGWKIPKH